MLLCPDIIANARKFLISAADSGILCPEARIHEHGDGCEPIHVERLVFCSFHDCNLLVRVVDAAFELE